MKAKVFIFCFFILGLTFLGLVFPYFTTIEEGKYDFLVYIPKVISKPEPDTKINFLAVGDIMLDRGVRYKVKNFGDNDYTFPFQKIKPALESADILFGNLESLISDKGRKVGSACCSFRADPKAIDGLMFAGFDVLTVANNHDIDYTSVALLDSLERLQKTNIEYVGAGKNEEEAFGLKIKELKETKIGFLGYSIFAVPGWRAGENSPGIALITEKDKEKVKNDIKLAKEKVDILVVSPHFGIEYATKQNKEQEKYYKEWIDSGADIIIGHHPHVIQPIEKYNNGWIAYSLGNFVFDQDFSENTMKGIILKIAIENKKIQDVTSEQFKMNKNYQPEIISKEVESSL